MNWDSIIGLERAKDVLQAEIVFPMKRPELFRGDRQPLTSTLLYGPSGNDSLWLARAAAGEAGVGLMTANAADWMQRDWHDGYVVLNLTALQQSRQSTFENKQLTQNTHFSVSTGVGMLGVFSSWRAETPPPSFSSTSSIPSTDIARCSAVTARNYSCKWTRSAARKAQLLRSTSSVRLAAPGNKERGP